MIPNNKYYKTIAEITNDKTYTGFHSSIYYMKQISESYGNTYDSICCSNKYLKDFAESITGNTYNEFHNNLYYLREIASNVYSGDLAHNNENYYLNVISENTQSNKTPTTLVLTPPVLTYSDEFDVMGVLTESDNNAPISDAIIRLEWTVNNITHTETATTNSNGQVTFHRDAPTTIEEYSFKLLFNGNLTYSSTSSSIVTVMPNKESTMIDLTSPINNAEYYTDDVISINGTLKESGELSVISNKNILVKQSDNLITTLTTDNNGAFTGTINTSNIVTGTLKIEFETDNFYSSSYIERNITITNPYIDLIGDKSVLSFKDGESCVLSATLHDKVVIGKTVIFEVRKKSDDSLVCTLTGVTDSTGVATVSYDSRGVGDVQVSARCGSLLTQTYSIKDATIVTNTEELTIALLNAQAGESIYLNAGTYTCEQDFTIRNISLYANNDATISNQGTDSKYYSITIYDCIVDGINFIRGYSTPTNLNALGGVNVIQNCQFNDERNTWGGCSIYIKHSSDSSTEVKNCYFYGNKSSNGYGHYNSSICIEHNTYNVSIHHNTFNHPAGGNSCLHGGNKGKAVACINGNSRGTCYNTHLYCNQYLGTGDTNNYLTEESCPDSN